STLTLTGEDASFEMDREERNAEHPGLSDEQIVLSILGDYSGLGITPEVTAPEVTDQPAEDEHTPTQQGSDYQHLVSLAQRHGFAFYLVPGPALGQSRAVWGPPLREGLPQ